MVMDEDVKTLKEQQERIEEPIKKLLSYSKKYKNKIIIGLSAALFSIIFDLMPPYIVSIVIDEAIAESNTQLLYMLGGALVFAYAARSVFDYIQNNFLFKFAQDTIYQLRIETYQHLQQLSLGFFSRNTTGKMMSKLSNDTNRLERFLSHTLRDIFRNTIMFILIGIVLFWMNWRLALIAFWPIPVIGFMTYKFAHRIRPKWDEVRESVSDVNSKLDENISGISVIKGFTMENYEQKKVEEVSDKYRTTNKESIDMWTKFFPVLSFIISIGSVMIIFFGGGQVIEGTLSLGILVAFNGYIWKFYSPAKMLGWLSNSYQRAAASAARVFGVLEEPIDIKDEGTVELDDVEGRIEFRRIGFKYEPEKEGEKALSDINLDIQPKQNIAFVGESGSGKTTLTKLLMRFYEPNEGCITVDDHNIKDIKLKSLRKAISIVSQDTFLFNDTVENNIRYGKPDASEEEIRKAAELAAADGFIKKLEDGYDTVVGEDGVKLSGGQKQRISIARAILKDAPILIMDEATSNVDAITELKIQEAIKNLIKDRTSLIIAHDLSTARIADKIVALKDGKVVEEGTHDELLNKKGYYHKLWQIQTKKAKDEYLI